MKQHLEVRIRTGFYFYLALLLFLLPLRWLLAALLAAAVHELGHLLALKLLKQPVECIEFGIGGAKIHTPQLSRWQELLCALAGPVAGSALIFLLPLWPQLALCGFVQSGFNLLPILPFDGGRVISCAFWLIFDSLHLDKSFWGGKLGKDTLFGRDRHDLPNHPPERPLSLSGRKRL